MLKLRAVERGILCVLDLGETAEPSTPPFIAPAVDAEFEEVHTDKTAESLAQATNQPDPTSISSRLESGRRCVVARVQRQIAAFGWISHGLECVGELERDFRMQPGAAYVWDCVTLPAFRKNGLYTALLCHINRQLASENISRVWIGTSQTNQPSLKGIIRAGYTPTIRLVYRRLLVFRWMQINAEPDAKLDAVNAALRAYVTPYERIIGHALIGLYPSLRPYACG